LYRAGIEVILGLRTQGAFLLLTPCIPKAWPQFEIVYKYRSARYEIEVENPDGVGRGVARAELDGKTLPDGATRIPLVDDGRLHAVRVILG
jgi:cyclic beta-1,2-glucan synthetase